MAQKLLPFGIDFVVEQDLVPLGIKKIPNSNGYSFNCPFCTKKGLKPDRKHKYAINIYKNVGHCMRCGAGHGIITLHRDLVDTGLTNEEAKQDLYNRWKGLPSDVRVELSKVQEKHEEESKKQLEPAPIELRNEVYQKFLEQLSLSEKHHQDLLDRGLTEEEIKQGMYKSVPSVGLSSFAKNCISYETYDALKRHVKWGIPGFYDIRTPEPKIVKCDPGYFVPVRDEFYRISGMQIRYDPLPEDAPQTKKDHYAKYKWFNSNFKDKTDGCTASGCENIHYASPFYKSEESVILTEGVLKADIAARLGARLKNYNNPIHVLGLVGVYNTEGLSYELIKLKECGLKKVVIAVDMDYRQKKQVADALESIKEKIQNVGLDYEVFDWNPKYKGIDDYFLAVLQNRRNLN